ncbi:WD40 repeat domain-containing protein [Nocardia colli]|uniref:WD40 repeat domain-containing protein n=1 Tax=Nocardia colli TaxID=2545717 RepID=UPI0035DF3369
MSGDDRIYLWDVTDPGKPVPGPVLDNETHTAALMFDPEGEHLFTGGDDRFIRALDIRQARLVNKVMGHYAAGGDFTIDDSGHFLASGSADATVVAWDIRDPAHITKLGSPPTSSVVRMQLWSASTKPTTPACSASANPAPWSGNSTPTAWRRHLPPHGRPAHPADLGRTSPFNPLLRLLPHLRKTGPMNNLHATGPTSPPLIRQWATPDQSRSLNIARRLMIAALTALLLLGLAGLIVACVM